MVDINDPHSFQGILVAQFDQPLIPSQSIISGMRYLVARKP